MKCNAVNGYQEIRIGSEQERRAQQEYIDKYNENMRRKMERNSEIGHAVKYVLFTPFIIALHILAMLFKFGGSILSIGLPYGLYCAYKTIVQMNAGVALADIKQTTFVCLFAILPFIALTVSVLFDRVGDYLEWKK